MGRGLIEIRKPFEREAEAVNSLIESVFKECVAPDYSEEGIRFFLKLCNAEEVRIKTVENCPIIVASENDVVVGVLWTRDINHISRYFVDVKHQRKGIGRQLFNHLLEGIKTEHPEIKDITVNSSPFACKAYESLGFKRTDHEQNGNGMKYIPMVYNLERHKMCNPA